MQWTSVKAYRENVANGILDDIRLEIYIVLGKEKYARTAGELARISPLSNRQIDSVRPRFAELVAIGAIENVGARKCEYSGKTAKTYEISDKIITKEDMEALDVKGRVFWAVKCPGKIGKVFSNKKQAKQYKKEYGDAFELIKVREIISKIPATPPQPAP